MSAPVTERPVAEAPVVHDIAQAMVAHGIARSGMSRGEIRFEVGIYLPGVTDATILGEVTMEVLNLI